MEDRYLTSREAKLILLVAQWIVNEYRPVKMEKILTQNLVDWENFNFLLAQHELPSFAYVYLKEQAALIPVSEFNLLRYNYYFALERLVRQEKEFLELVDIFQNKGVDLLPLKGAAFLVGRLYGANTGLRLMEDIDILVKKEHLALAQESAQTLGFQKETCGFKENYWREKSYHFIFTKNRKGKFFSYLEIHWLLDYPGKVPLLPLLWERVRKLRVENREVSLMSVEDTLFCLALHLRRFGNVLALKAACDFALLITKYKNLDWDYIVKEARSGQMCSSLYFRFAQANILFDMAEPKPIINGLRVSSYKKRLIEKFILKNTFLIRKQQDNRVFLKNHFLVYDNFRKPLSMVFMIPQEQFAKFYQLTPYSIKTFLLHKLRFLFFPYCLLVSILKLTLNKITKSNKESWY